MKATSSVTSAVDKLKQEFKAAAQEAAQLERAAKRIVEENATPQERYNSQIEKMAKIFVAGKIDVEQMDRALAKYRAQLEQATQSHNPLNDAHNKAFGPGALANIVAMAGQTALLVDIFKMGTDSLKEFADERKRLAEETATGLVATGQLSAAGGTQSDLDFARDVLEAKGITKGDDQSIRAVTGMVRAKLTDSERAYVTGLAENKIISPEDLAEYPQQIRVNQRAFGGTFQSTDAMIRKAAYDTRVSPGDFSLGMTKLSKAGSEAGLTQAQLATMYATEINKTRNPKTAATELQEMLKTGDQFEGSDAKFYAQELVRVQGAPSEIAGPSLVRTDPQSAAALANEESTAGYQAYLKKNTSTRENLFSALVTARKESIIQKEGEFFGGIDAYMEERMDEKGLWGIIPSVRSIPSSENRQLRNAVSESERGSYDPGLVSTIEKYLESIDHHTQRQTKVIERSDRSSPPPSGPQE